MAGTRRTVQQVRGAKGKGSAVNAGTGSASKRGAKVRRTLRLSGNAHLSKPERTEKAKQLFLKELRAGFSLKRACLRAGVNKLQYRNWCMADADFDKAVSEALEDGIEELEDCAVTRAKRNSDSLMMFLLAGRKPEKYRRTAEATGNVEVTIKGGLPDAPVAPDAEPVKDEATTLPIATS
jgi:hypothetical protein